MENNRDNFKSGKKQFSRDGNNKFNSKSGNFKRNDRNFDPRKSSSPNYSNNSRGPERYDKFDRNDTKPKFDDRKPRFGDNKPRFDNNKPRFGDNKSRFDNNKPRFDDRKPRFGDNKPRFDNNKPRFGDNKSRFDDNKPRFDDRKPRFDNNKPRFERTGNFNNRPDKLNRNKTERTNTQAKFISEPIVSSVEQEDTGMVYGRNAVIELLKSGKSIDKLFVQSGQREGSITMIFAEAVKKSIPIIEVEKNKLDSMINNSAHQGVIALASEKEYCSPEDILRIAQERNEKPFILIADKIMDPHNLGAIIRTAECAGVHGIIIPKRHAAGISPIVTKTSAGASIHMAIAKVANIATTIEELQEKGLWVFSSALDVNPDSSDKEDKQIKDYGDADYSMPLALVVGNEGEGLSPIIIQKSDFLVKIPLFGKIESLNVSCASAILMYEISRQRKQK